MVMRCLVCVLLPALVCSAALKDPQVGGMGMLQPQGNQNGFGWMFQQPQVGAFSPFASMKPEPMPSSMKFVGGMGGWSPFFNPNPWGWPPRPAPTPTPTPASTFAPVDMDVSLIDSWCNDNIQAANTLRESLVSSTMNKTAVLDVANEIDYILSNTGMLSHLWSETHPDNNTRIKATDCSLAVSEAAVSLSLDRSVYEVVMGVASDAAQDATAQRRFNKLIELFETSGVNLDSAEDRQRVQTLKMEIEQLSTQFGQNINGDTRQVTRPVGDASLAGLPDDFIASHTVGNQVIITTDYPDYQPAMKLAEDSGLRRELFIEFENRANPVNGPILDQVLAKRHEMAVLLGFNSFAEMVTKDKMIETAEHADSFTREVAQLTSSTSDQDMVQLLEMKQQIDPTATTVEAYDSSFLSEKLHASLYNVDQAEVGKYFRYTNTRDGVIWLCELLFGVEFEMQENVPVWHTDVQVFDVKWKGSKNVIGRVFLDMFPREHKYKHAAQFPIRPGVQGVQIPEGALICNFPKTGPMQHGQVTTFFHEFGHLMHHIIGGQEKKWAEFSGVATEWDFVEAPSQMLENWAFDYDTLSNFALHQDTNEIIPQSLVTNMKNADLFGRGMHTRQQMFYSQLSLQLHNGDPSLFDTAAKALEIQSEFSPFAHVDGCHFHLSFGHLMGYSAIYYTYMWSQALAQHMFKVFNDSGNLLDVSTALRYRDYVIREGGIKPAKVLVYDFTEREFDLTALHEYLQEQPQSVGNSTAAAEQIHFISL